MSMTPQYEFTKEQNDSLSGLAGSMRFVGLCSVLFGLFALLITLVTLLFMFRDRLPADFRTKATEYMKKAQENLPKEAQEYSLDAIPKDNTFLGGVAIFTGVVGLVFLLQGVWSRNSAAEFQKIVDTKGNDMAHLMNAIAALRGMYGLISTLLSVAVLAGLVAVGLSLYQYFGAK